MWNLKTKEILFNSIGSMYAQQLAGGIPVLALKGAKTNIKGAERNQVA